MTSPTTSSEAHGLAALALCESLLLALKERKVIGNHDLRDILADVVTTHNEAASISEKPEVHHAVVELVQRISASCVDPPPDIEFFASDDVAVEPTSKRRTQTKRTT